MAAEALVPPWLESLLTAPFFTTCLSHEDSPRSERNMFCLDCPSATAFCFYCRSSSHSDHRTIQIRRSSYHDVVRVSEIQKVLDIGGVQTYVINSARVLFLNERPQPKTNNGNPTAYASSGSTGNASTGVGGHHVCETCSRTLLDQLRFCSLGCKLDGIKRFGNACFVVDEAGDVEGGDDGSGSGGRRKKAIGERGGGGGGGGEHAMMRTKRWRRRGRSTVVAGSGGREEAFSESDGHAMYSPAGSSSSDGIATPTTPYSHRRRKGIPHRSPLASS